MRKLKHWVLIRIDKIAVALALMALTTPVLAVSSGLPWEGPLQKIIDSISGPVAKMLGIVAIILAGLGIAFGEASSGMRRLFQVVLGLSIAFTASSLIVSVFGFSGGTVIL